MSENVLKPCPFCGGHAYVAEDYRFVDKEHNFPKWYILCRDCAARTTIATLDFVVMSWNRRVGESDDKN